MNKFSYKVPASLQGTFSLPQHAIEIHKLISSEFPETFIVGGAIRNILLKKKVIDVDIATRATPNQVASVLKKHHITYSLEHEKFGVVVAERNQRKIEITTFRTEGYNGSRYPEIAFARSPKQDSIRRDFTINALYYSPYTKEILDYHNGLADIRKGIIRFIGDPAKRITEDPLRIIRAYRFQLQYNLKFEKQTASALQKNLHLLKKISKTRLQREINSVATKKLQKQLQKVIHNLY